MKQLLTLLFMVLFGASSIFAQIAINQTGNAANASAMLDIQSDSLGLLIPRMSSGERASIASPADGLLVFDNSTGTFWYYDAVFTLWKEFRSGINKTLTDTDGDTRIEVEGTSDDDKIRFYMAGTEFFTMDSGRVA